MWACGVGGWRFQVRLLWRDVNLGGLFLGNQWKNGKGFSFFIFICFQKRDTASDQGASSWSFLVPTLHNATDAPPLEKKAHAIWDMANSWNAKAGGPRPSWVTVRTERFPCRLPFPCSAVCVFSTSHWNKFRFQISCFVLFLVCCVFCLHVVGASQIVRKRDFSV